MDIALTTSAAGVVAGLAPSLKALVGRFLRQEVPKYVETHEPVQFGSLEGDYWVVRPSDNADQPIFVITRRHKQDTGDDQLVVLSAIVPGEPVPLAATAPDPVDYALGVEVLGSVKPAS